MPDLALYPLHFDPIYKEKVWGGRTLARLGRTLPDGDIGESWELADLSTTSVSGGGGGAERSRIVNGPLAGRSLHEVIEQYGSEAIGDLPLTDGGDFPLLVKFLDANADLSVQVHPSPQYAATHADAFLKNECWYVLHAEPGAVIYKGVKEGTTPERFRAAIADNTVVDLLISIPVTAGDFHYLPSGTCHALGAGVLAAEVQTPSDTTFRVYDWGRTGRELHIDQAMQCITFGPCDASRYEPMTTIHGEHAVTTRLCASEYFNVDRVTVNDDYVADLDLSQPVVWMVLEGAGRIVCGAAPDVDFEAGQTLLLPPGMKHGKVTVYRPTTWLEVTFPKAEPVRIA